MPTILITSMGGSGSNNLVETLRLSDPDGDFKVIGTHVDPFELGKARIDDIRLVPAASDADAYLDAHVALIDEFDVDLLIVNSDKEVAVIADHIDRITCAHLLPPAEITNAVQDKFRFHELLRDGGCQTVENIAISGWPDIDAAAQRVSRGGDRFWVRPRKGSGSLGATWVETPDQARKWIELCGELRGLHVEDFVFAPFLPGRDFNVSALWQNAEFAVGSAVERLRYFYADVSLSGMGSTPAVTRTADSDAPIRATIDAVEAIYRAFDVEPHGYFNADIKCGADDTPYLTEINIGRFPMISPHHDRTGRYNLLRLYIQLALDPERALPRDVFDLDPGRYILRCVDTETVFIDQARLDAMRGAAV